MPKHHTNNSGMLLQHWQRCQHEMHTPTNFIACDFIYFLQYFHFMSFAFAIFPFNALLTLLIAASIIRANFRFDKHQFRAYSGNYCRARLRLRHITLNIRCWMLILGVWMHIIMEYGVSHRSKYPGNGLRTRNDTWRTNVLEQIFIVFRVL